MFLNLSEEILKILKNTITDKKVSLHEPLFFNNEIKYIKKCIDTKMVSSIGKYVDEFENLLSRFIGVKYTIAVVNGTSALHLALLVSGLKSPVLCIHFKVARSPGLCMVRLNNLLFELMFLLIISL